MQSALTISPIYISLLLLPAAYFLLAIMFLLNPGILEGLVQKYRFLAILLLALQLVNTVGLWGLMAYGLCDVNGDASGAILIQRLLIAPSLVAFIILYVMSYWRFQSNEQSSLSALWLSLFTSLGPNFVLGFAVTCMLYPVLK